MSLVLGLDSSTQSLSAVILDTEKGIVAASHSVNFGGDLAHYNQPHGYDETGARGEIHSNPLMWLEALDLLLVQLVSKNIDLSQIKAVSGSGQQHGSIYLRANFNDTLKGLTAQSDLKTQLANCFSRLSSPIWMDSSTSKECAEIAHAVGGNKIVCSKSGSVTVERFTGPQIRKFAKTDPDSYAQTGTIHLVSSFFASIFAGKTVAIDHGDGAGMNLMNLSDLDWDQDLLSATAEDLSEKLPPCAPSNSKSGPISHYFVEKYGFSPTCETIIWSGDNPCSLIGMGAASPGKVVISLGTSDTLFAAMPAPKTDPNGFGHVFGNPAGGYMSLICFKNGSLAREAIKEKYELNWDSFEKDALSQTPAGNNGSMMLPFYEPEITPVIDTEGPIFSSDHHYSSGEAVRAVLESQFLNMRTHSDWLGVSPSRIFITGGASENDGIAQVISNVFSVQVDRLDVPGSATIGAGMRAALGLGEDLDDLESKFSQPKEGRTIKPNPISCDIYNGILPKFKAFLAEQFTS